MLETPCPPRAPRCFPSPGAAQPPPAPPPHPPPPAAARRPPGAPRTPPPPRQLPPLRRLLRTPQRSTCRGEGGMKAAGRGAQRLQLVTTRCAPPPPKHTHTVPAAGALKAVRLCQLSAPLGQRGQQVLVQVGQRHLGPGRQVAARTHHLLREVHAWVRRGLIVRQQRLLQRQRLCSSANSQQLTRRSPMA